MKEIKSAPRGGAIKTLARRREKMENVKEVIVYQECGRQLLNVYRGDDYGLSIGQRINDPAEHHIEGMEHTTLRRVQ